MNFKKNQKILLPCSNCLKQTVQRFNIHDKNDNEYRFICECGRYNWFVESALNKYNGCEGYK